MEERSGWKVHCGDFRISSQQPSSPTERLPDEPPVQAVCRPVAWPCQWRCTALDERASGFTSWSDDGLGLVHPESGTLRLRAGQRAVELLRLDGSLDGCSYGANVCEHGSTLSKRLAANLQPRT